MSGLTSQLSDGFFTKLKDIAARRNFDPEAAMAVMFSESDLDPTSIHRTAPASGIFGKMFDTREEAEDFARLSAEEQLDAYDTYMAPYTNVPKPSAANLYQLNFLPASIQPGQVNYRGIDDDAVLASSTGSGYGGREAGFYHDNAAYLDIDRDGTITVGDLGRRLRIKQQEKPEVWAELVARLDAPSRAFAKAPLILGVGLLLGAAAYAVTSFPSTFRRFLPI